MRILREVVLGVLLHDLLVLGDDFLQRLRVEVGVELGFLLLLLAVEHCLQTSCLGISSTTLPNIWIRRR